MDNFDYGSIMNKIFRLNFCIIYSTKNINPQQKLGYFLFNVKIIKMKQRITAISWVGRMDSSC